ncbi:hypothetical protein DEU56DRAFT_815863 [Suillus clintonianus]|uniref:uncharacterized protein n=1 Tax=Suillus clintonianus TaxID=1904413 RepID=UPI001B8730B1|nr:uncharacterized protein DEU56DRAFT_815863 [Suillus clintonianus]KAG2130399.1 hypothetical protein DEU56DRAFT_815863 [Suillus clintonianus]
MFLISSTLLRTPSAASSALAMVAIKFAFSSSVLISFLDEFSSLLMDSEMMSVTAVAILLIFFSWSVLSSSMATARIISMHIVEREGVWIVKSSNAVISESIVISVAGVMRKHFSSSDLAVCSFVWNRSPGRSKICVVAAFRPGILCSVGILFKSFTSNLCKEKTDWYA